MPAKPEESKTPETPKTTAALAQKVALYRNPYNRDVEVTVEPDANGTFTVKNAAGEITVTGAEYSAEPKEGTVRFLPTD